ncbi:MAG: hypothetical protein QM775_22415 [Pirellulales bacterium]
MIFVLPLMLYPLLGMSLMQVTQFIREQPTKVLLLGFREPTDFPKLVRADSDGTQHFADELFGKAEQVRLLTLELRNNDLPEKEAEEQAKKLVQDGKYEAVLYFPADFNKQLSAFREQLRKLDADQTPDLKLMQPVVPSPTVYFNTANEKSQLAYRRLRRRTRPLERCDRPAEPG